MSTSMQNHLKLDDDAVLMKPVRPKRSLASILSIDNNTNLSSSSSSSSLPLSKRHKPNRVVAVVDSKWILKEVPELPFLYLKEKTSVVILNDNPQDIASRIVDCAKSHSAFGEYNGDKAKATLEMDDVEFTIQLFQVTEQNNRCIIVEMQRKNGSSIQFHTIARSILKAAKKQQQQPSKQVNNRKRLVVRRNATTTTTTTTTTTIRNRTTSPNSTNQEEVFACTLEMVDALLKKDRVDANLLGMESLQLLTTPKSASDAMVKYVSNCIITGEIFDDIKGTITSLIAKYNIDDDDQGSSSSSSNSSNNYVVEGYYQKMRICALAVLSNSLKNALPKLKMQSSTKVDSIFSSDDWLNDHGGLLILLFNELQKDQNDNDDDHEDNDDDDESSNTTKSNPKEAYLAATCLEQVLEHSTIMREYAMTKLDAKRVIKESMDVGYKFYPLLRSVCSRMLDLLSKGEEGK